MAIGWIDNNRSKIDSDVSIKLGKGSKNVVMSFKQGVMSVRFNNAERLAVGYDRDLYRLYFAPCETGGYKVSGGSGKARYQIQIQCVKFEEMVTPSALAGEFLLKFDPDERLYYVDLTETIKFQSKKIREV